MGRHQDRLLNRLEARGGMDKNRRASYRVWVWVYRGDRHILCHRLRRIADSVGQKYTYPVLDLSGTELEPRLLVPSNAIRWDTQVTLYTPAQLHELKDRAWRRYQLIKRRKK